MHSKNLNPFRVLLARIEGMQTLTNSPETLSIASIIESQIKRHFLGSNNSDVFGVRVSTRLEKLQAGWDDARENVLNADCQFRMHRVAGEAREAHGNHEIGLGAYLRVFELAKSTYHNGKYYQAWRAFRDILQLCKSIRFLCGQAIARYYLGTIYRIAENQDRAHQLYQQALIGFQSVQHKAAASECINNLGIMYLWQGDYERAFVCFEKAIAFLGNAREWRLRAFVDLNKSEYFAETGDYRLAANDAANALGLLFKSRSPIGTAKISKLFGRIFWKSGDIDLAKIFYEESLHLYRMMNIPLGLANCYKEFGNLLQGQGMQPDSEGMLQKARAIYETLGLPLCSKTSSSVNRLE